MTCHASPCGIESAASLECVAVRLGGIFLPMLHARVISFAFPACAEGLGRSRAISPPFMPCAHQAHATSVSKVTCCLGRACGAALMKLLGVLYCMGHHRENYQVGDHASNTAWQKAAWHLMLARRNTCIRNCFDHALAGRSTSGTGRFRVERRCPDDSAWSTAQPGRWSPHACRA